MTKRTVENIMQRTGRSREAALEALIVNQGGRLISPEEVAAKCIWLASEAGRSINGEALTV